MDKPWFDDQCKLAFGLKQEAHFFGGPVIALELAGNSLSATKQEEMNLLGGEAYECPVLS